MKAIQCPTCQHLTEQVSVRGLFLYARGSITVTDNGYVYASPFTLTHVEALSEEDFVAECPSCGELHPLRSWQEVPICEITYKPITKNRTVTLSHVKALEFQHVTIDRGRVTMAVNEEVESLLPQLGMASFVVMLQ